MLKIVLLVGVIAVLFIGLMGVVGLALGAWVVLKWACMNDRSED